MSTKMSKDDFVAKDDTYCNSYDVYRRGLLEQQKEWVSNQVIPILSSYLNKPFFRVLSVGSGEGDVDMLLLDEIIKELNKSNTKCSIFYTVIERNGNFISRFQNRVQEKKDYLGNVKFVWHEGTFEEMTASQNKDLGEYDLVHFMHSLYYMDADKALKYCMNNLVVPDGCVMCVVQTEQSIYAKNCRKYKGRIHNCFDGFEVYTDETLEPIAAKNNWRCKVEVGKRILDLSDILGEQLNSHEGNKLLDFFFHAEDLKKYLEEDVLREILEHFKANSIVENGRYKSIGHEAIVFFFKDC